MRTSAGGGGGGGGGGGAGAGGGWYGGRSWAVAQEAVAASARMINPLRTQRTGTLPDIEDPCSTVAAVIGKFYRMNGG